MTTRLSSGLVGVALCLALILSAQGKFIRVEVEQVPVERLVTNLEQAVKKDPKNAALLVNLARAHAMAYALKTETAEVRKGNELAGPWFGHVPPTVPYSNVLKTDDPAKQKQAREHLAKAVAHFREAVELAPTDLRARLGFALVLEQSGEKTQAVARYRTLIEEAWKTEKDETSLPLGGHTIVTEATRYLVPLLDTEKDKAEIDRLTERAKRLNSLPRPITPVAIPLRGGLRASEIEDRTAAVAFDADGSGILRRWTWIKPDAGWLVYDPKGRGAITSGLQLFGSVAFWLFWENGYEALAALDDDGDGALRGRELTGLAIWRDANGDGRCARGEVRPVADYGIVAVSCRSERDGSHSDAIWYSPAGVTFADGHTRPTFDLILRPQDPARVAAELRR